VNFVDEDVKIARKISMDVDFSRDRLDGDFEATGRLIHQIAAKSGENLQQPGFFSTFKNLIRLI